MMPPEIVNQSQLVQKSNVASRFKNNLIIFVVYSYICRPSLKDVAQRQIQIHKLLDQDGQDAHWDFQEEDGWERKE